MERNIRLITIIFSLNVAWFWLGIWVPYYLRFTNYSGIGLIETVVVASAFLLELPTGAFADLIGKKKTLHLVYLSYVIGNVVMASATHFWHILLAVLFLGIGTSLYSGTRDAILYDTLITLKREGEYERILSSIQKYGLILMAGASAIGGWMYTISPSLPFWGVGVIHLICGILTFWLVEPPIDTQHFSLRVYVDQMKHGVRQLFSASQDLQWILKLLIVGSFVKFLAEGFDPALAIRFGLNELQLGYVFAAIPLISAAGAHWYEKYSGKISRNIWWYLIVGTFFIGPLLSPIIGLFLGVGALLIRNIFYPIAETLASNTVNRAVESKYRATTLSAYNMLEALPYVFFSALLGRLVDGIGIQIVVMGLCIVFFIVYLVFPRIIKLQARR